MRTLAQIEPRTPVSPGGPTPVVLAQPGSYYLTGNLSVSAGDAIVIAVSGVTLDLNGFMIASSDANLSGTAIYLADAITDVSVTNGNIRGTTTYVGGAFSGGGFRGGISYAGLPGTSPRNVRVEGVAISGVAVGIDLDPASPSNFVRGCVINVASGTGIRAGTVADCSAATIGGAPITAFAASNCAGVSVNGGPGVTSSQPNLASLAAAADGLSMAISRAEPRTPIPGGSSTVTISTPGSYYLTGNIVVSNGDGIHFVCAGVSLDLNGFSVVSSAQPPSGTAIRKLFGSDNVNVQVSNGFVRSAGSNAGWENGIDLLGVGNTTVQNVSLDSIHGTGIFANTVRDCSVSNCTATGIQAQLVRGCRVTYAQTGISADVVSECTAYYCSFAGITCDVGSNCVVGFGSGSGINGGVLQNCKASAADTAIYAGRTALNCSGYSANGTGIHCLEGVVTNCYGVTQSASANDYGILAFTANGSRGQGPGANAQQVTNKYNMP